MMRDYCQTAIEMVKEAGQLQLDRLQAEKNIEYKGKFNIVTEVDRACEKLITDEIKSKFPSHAILAEEGIGEVSQKSDWLWIIDPLDGTTNYAHRYPLFSVSIALLHHGKVVLGVVYEPNRDELFVAERGGGVVMNDKPIRVSKSKEIYSSMLSTGFAYNVADVDRNNVGHFNAFIKKCHAIRRDGVASVDLCYLANGRYDGFWELFLKPWDIAAASLIVEEAGGMVTAFDGKPLDIYGDEILASNGHIHKEMMQILAEGKK